LNPQQAALQEQQQMLMNQMMMQMMQNQQGGQQQPAGAAPAVPQTKEEIKAYLDQLDVKLASGEITESAYDKLYAKWEARLKELDG
jgi:hypothetical protein